MGRRRRSLLRGKGSAGPIPQNTREDTDDSGSESSSESSSPESESLPAEAVEQPVPSEDGPFVDEVETGPTVGRVVADAPSEADTQPHPDPGPTADTQPLAAPSIAGLETVPRGMNAAPSDVSGLTTEPRGLPAPVEPGESPGARPETLHLDPRALPAPSADDPEESGPKPSVPDEHAPDPTATMPGADRRPEASEPTAEEAEGEPPPEEEKKKRKRKRKPTPPPPPMRFVAYREMLKGWRPPRPVRRRRRPVLITQAELQMASSIAAMGVVAILGGSVGVVIVYYMFFR